jgi:hypothetical protein
MGDATRKTYHHAKALAQHTAQHTVVVWGGDSKASSSGNVLREQRVIVALAITFTVAVSNATIGVSVGVSSSGGDWCCSHARSTTASSGTVAQRRITFYNNLEVVVVVIVSCTPCAHICGGHHLVVAVLSDATARRPPTRLASGLHCDRQA